MSRCDETHASLPGNFAPARFVVTILASAPGGAPRHDVFEQHGSSAPVRVAGPFPTEDHAGMARDAMNRADQRCRFCHTDDCGSPCRGCGL